MTDQAVPTLPDQRLQREGLRQPGPLIHNRWRWAAGIVGMACLVAGTVAVFVTDVEAGPVALVAAGVVFTFVAMGGRLPNRLKMGDNEAAWEAVADYVEETVDDATPEGKPREIERVIQLSESAPQVTSRTLRSVAAEAAALRAIQQAAYQSSRFRLSSSNSTPFDFSFESIDGKTRIYVIVAARLDDSLSATISDNIQRFSEGRTVIVFANDAFRSSTVSKILAGRQNVCVLYLRRMSAATVGAYLEKFFEDKL